MAMLRLELFARDLEAAQDFYEQVLGFDRSIVRADGYTVMRLDGVQIDLQPVDHLSDGHPVKPSEGERVGLGIEIVLEVADVREVYARVAESGWPIAKPLGERPWGLTDFRVLDPDGRFVRVTSSAGSGAADTYASARGTRGGGSSVQVLQIAEGIEDA